MITHENEQRIYQYLEEKKLSVDLSLEIHDHMYCQIAELMERKKIEFSEAFLECKQLWRKDLRIIDDAFLSGDNITVIQKQTNKQEQKKQFLNSFYLLTSIMLLFYVLGFIISGEHLIFASALLSIGVILINLFTQIVINYKTQFIKKSKRTLFNNHFGTFTTSLVFIQFPLRLLTSESPYKIFTKMNEDYAFIITILIMILASFFTLHESLILLNNYKKLKSKKEEYTQYITRFIRK